MEIWIFIRGYPGYSVSNLGRVRRANRSWPKNKRTPQYTYLKGSHNQDGYVQVSLTKNGKRTLKAVHRLVLEAFVGPCPEGLQCGHKNRVRDDNAATNLRWVTQKENLEGRVYTGKYVKRVPWVFTEARRAALAKARLARTVKAKARAAALTASSL